MNTLEQMMFNLPRLKHLELDCDCNIDVVDGQRWQIIVKKFVTFNVKFFLAVRPETKQLKSFRTAFWLDEKRWYMSYREGYFFSVPRFATKNADDDSLVPQYTTVPDDEIFYQKCDEMNLTQRFMHQHIHFPNVRALTLECNVSLRTIREAIDVGRICSLTLSSLSAQFPTRCLVLEMPNLSRIVIKSNLRIFMKQFRGTILDNIRTLILSVSVLPTDIDQFSKHLQTIFPRLEHLHVEHVLSIEKILVLLRCFQYLSTASFCYVRNRGKIRKEQCSTVESLANHMRSVPQWNCSYRFDGFKVFLWILSQSRDHPVSRSGIGSVIKRNLSSIMKSLMMKRSGPKE